jgi:hypothetical protein
MQDNHEQFKRLAESKRAADDYHPVVSPEVERIARFFWWIVGGLLGGAILVTLWVSSINANMVGFEKRITVNEAYRETTKARFDSDNTLHAQTASTLAEWKPEIEHVRDMWQMKIRGESNKEAFFREHGYAAPLGYGEPQKPTPTPTPTGPR